ncbi:hypothetical protein BC834DRAFT_313496 [Gloeopeniophorella convolvens]|nr:hypothetical protein BC834DRAFT_313496 [Gloeopeniophorella convolvens]
MISSSVIQFFKLHPSFDFDESAAPTREFSRRQRHFDWGEDDDTCREAREKLANALAEDFNAAYGTDADDLSNWHRLCCILKDRACARRDLCLPQGRQVRAREPRGSGISYRPSKTVRLGPRASAVLAADEEDIPEGLRKGRWRTAVPSPPDLPPTVKACKHVGSFDGLFKWLSGCAARRTGEMTTHVRYNPCRNWGMEYVDVETLSLGAWLLL